MVRFERNVLARVNPRNREIRRRTRMVGSFPDERSALMLVCARVRYVTSNEWSTRRYLDMSRLGETVWEANRSSPQGRAKTKVRKISGTTPAQALPGHHRRCREIPPPAARLTPDKTPWRDGPATGKEVSIMLDAFTTANPAPGLGQSALDAVAMRAPGRTRCINAENPDGGKGRAAMAASALGPSRKGSPCISTVRSGESVTLMDVEGPGVIRHIWMTVTDRTSPTGPDVLRNLILEFYWDGEDSPSVQCPIGDFFCCGHAQSCTINSIPVMVNPNRGFNCYFAMPFEHARIVLRNDHNEDVPAFFYQIDYTEYDQLPADTMRFHAQWRRQRVTELAHDYVVLDGVEGHGTYVGTYLALTALESRWWGEGEFKFYIDGDGKYPTWCSTGAEDYFGGAWSFAEFDEHGRMHERTFTGPYLGFPFYSQNLAGRESAYWDTATPVTRGLYRWHIPDPIYFERDLRVEWQQIGTEEAGNFERQDDVATVAYWYQSEPHKPFAPIGDRAFRRPR